MKKVFLILIAVVIILIIGTVFYLLNKSVCCSASDIETFLSSFSSIFGYTSEQEPIVLCAKKLYNEKKSLMTFSNQCLGTCGDYAIDIVHVPRSEEDDLAENQCEDFRQKQVNHFIELNKNGEIVRIV